jgi:hypothetical protein
MTVEDKRRFSLFPKPLANCVEPVTRPVLKAQGLAGSRILTDWQSIVGPSLYRHTLPEKLSFPRGQKTGGTLVISTENGFATELQHMQPVILERLAVYFGYQAISRIVISHSWVAAPAAETKLRTLPSRLPPECQRLADEVSDPDLKEALLSLAKTLSGQNSS